MQRRVRQICVSGPRDTTRAIKGYTSGSRNLTKKLAHRRTVSAAKSLSREVLTARLRGHHAQHRHTMSACRSRSSWHDSICPPGCHHVLDPQWAEARPARIAGDTRSRPHSTRYAAGPRLAATLRLRSLPRATVGARALGEHMANILTANGGTPG